jgi:NAD(P)-dependent dehydrogenase (short-subunit alcohol dehydrogenase family)
MSIATGTSPIQPEPKLAGQTVVVIGGSAGIGLETARLARAEGAKLILAARNPERLERVSRELGTLSTAAFDATNFDQLKKFFDELPTPIDHVLVTGPGPYYAPLAISKRRGKMSKPISCCRCRSLAMPRRRFAPEAPCSSWAVPVAAARRQGSLSSRLSPPHFPP